MVEVKVKIPERKGLIEKIRTFLSGEPTERETVIKLEKVGPDYRVKHEHRVPEVDHPVLGRVPAYSAYISVGGAGGSAMTFVYTNKEFADETKKALRLEDYEVFEDPEGALRIFRPPVISEEEQKKFLELYGRLVRLWHKYH